MATVATSFVANGSATATILRSKVSILLSSCISTVDWPCLAPASQVRIGRQHDCAINSPRTDVDDVKRIERDEEKRIIAVLPPASPALRFQL